MSVFRASNLMIRISNPVLPFQPKKVVMFRIPQIWIVL